jgi:phage replication O-like protein O
MAKKLDAPNYTQIPNDLLGNIEKGNRVSPGLMARLEGAELKVFLAVCRMTFGYHQTERRASLSMIQKFTGLSRQGVINAAKALENEHRVIERSFDGGVTLWKVLVNSVDQGVNSVDQGVNSVDRHLRKKPEKNKRKKQRERDPRSLKILKNKKQQPKCTLRRLA